MGFAGQSLAALADETTTLYFEAGHISDLEEGWSECYLALMKSKFLGTARSRNTPSLTISVLLREVESLLRRFMY